MEVLLLVLEVPTARMFFLAALVCKFVKKVRIVDLNLAVEQPCASSGVPLGWPWLEVLPEQHFHASNSSQTRRKLQRQTLLGPHSLMLSTYAA